MFIHGSVHELSVMQIHGIPQGTSKLVKYLIAEESGKCALALPSRPAGNMG